MTAVTRRMVLGAAGLIAGCRCGRQTSLAQEGSGGDASDWLLLDPDSVGLSRAQLDAAGDHAAANMPDITGIVVVRRDGIAWERYFGDEFGQDDPVNIRSITKSITGTLTGIAIGDGHFALDTPIGDLIPDLIPADADPLTPTIAIESLLTMSSGWAWDIGSDWQTLIASENWVEMTLSLPVAYQQGTVYAYNTGGSHLLGVIAQEVTGRPLEDFATERLWTPLGINAPDWMRSPQGDVNGGSGLELSPRDLARFGLLSLRDGVWNGETVVPAGWFPEATRFHLQGDSTGYAGYGYQWWVVDYENGFHAYFGLGFGSNYLYVVPGLDLVVVVLKGFDTPPSPVSIVRPFIEEWILAAVVG